MRTEPVRQVRCRRILLITRLSPFDGGREPLALHAFEELGFEGARNEAQRDKCIFATPDRSIEAHYLVASIDRELVGVPDLARKAAELPGPLFYPQLGLS